ncbi:MAG: SRPBCC family protein [Acidobacteriota bacterium]
MRLFRFERTQILRVGLAEAWAFFSDPRNLAKITPPELHLSPSGTVPGQMHPGMIVTYRIRLGPGIPVRWITEITHVEAPHIFVDEQRFGPYRFWHHLHRFRPAPDGVNADDLVHYGLYGGPLAGLLNAAVVRPQLERIFEFRRRSLEGRFGQTAHLV